ncbi:MAG TPA: protein phosphatase 2C domain-containing protein, partial [Fibrobacteria bacterium]|nr:protein phosphatase 2C domain-containing protein [Fibrobacteria bacterium]
PRQPTDVTADALRAALRVPFVAEGQPVGLMIVHTSQKARFAPGEVALLGAADSGEYSGQTVFLDPSQLDTESLGKRLCYALVDHLEAVFLLTDGVSDPRFETQERMEDPGEWAALWRELTDLLGDPGTSLDAHERLLGWLDFWSPGNHDDRTIAMVVPERKEG